MDEINKLAKTGRKINPTPILTGRRQLDDPVPTVNGELVVNVTGRRDSDAAANRVNSEPVQRVRRREKERKRWGEAAQVISK